MQTATPRAQSARIEFYRKTGKIHPRTVAGRYNSLRWAMVWLTQIIFYGACWLRWDGRQAVLFDIAERKFYLFGLVLWPQDALLLAVLLIASATALFFVTALAGRVFCGFACPQTVYTAIFRWVEEKVEGDHLARMRLDQAPASARKSVLKGAKHSLWLAIALWTGISFVGYFSPIDDLLPRLLAAEPGPWEGFWVYGYATFTYLQAGFAREMVCLHMCPYSRFQGVMVDPQTKNVAYDSARGEPRGPIGKKQAATLKAATATASTAAASGGRTAQGDCVDCALCVQACPTGIDIRAGFQYACINCGLCIDACDEVMTRIGIPTGLIRFAPEQTTARASGIPSALHRPRVQAYLALLAVLILAGVWLLSTRTPLTVDVLHDRQTLSRLTTDGRIENDYTLKVANMLEQPRRFRLQVDGPVGVHVAGSDTFEVPAGSVRALPVTLSLAADTDLHGAQSIHLVIDAVDGTPTRAVERTVFILP